MASYIGKNGSVRLYESTDTARSLAGSNVEREDGVFTDITAAAHSAAASLTGTLLVTAGDFVYIGHTSKFARINLDVSVAAVGLGTLVVEYYNGTVFTTAVPELLDGTSVGGTTFGQDGVISFKVPIDWALQGDASLDADKFYVRLSSVSTPGTPPNAEQLIAVDGMFYPLQFEAMDHSAPEGRQRREEIPILDRANLNTGFHYVQGSDEPEVEPVEVTFSLRLNDDINASTEHELFEALRVNNPQVTTWTGVGVSTKGDTSLDGTNQTPQFSDGGTALKKTLALQIVWTSQTTGLQIGREYNEIWFDLSTVEFSEAEDGVNVSLTGLVFGTIREIADFAYQY